ncbi:MAG: hypothetical protein CVT80_12645, partial [Alphaproteobacteria bacterium HGW-Alphaproteobacteria-2]
ERMRTQSAIDRAVLAAASLSQPLSAQEVVESYFQKSGVVGEVSISEDRGINFRTVSATSQVEVPTRFMRMVDRTMLLGQLSPELAVHDGVFTLGTASGATAIENIPNIEISLVLDNSGSMGSNQRLTNLKVAAKEFVNAMLCNPTDPSDGADCTVEDGRVSMTIVPYNEQVNAGEDLLNQFNVSSEHNFSHCVTFDEADFASRAIPVDMPLQRTGHFDPWSSNRVTPRETSRVCKTDAGAPITVLEKDRTRLKQRIDALVANGNTSIDLGMKWGVALLDPAAQPVVNGLADLNIVNSVFRGRPVAYDNTETIKVVVLMTDGENTSQHQLKPQYRDGPSEFWRSTKLSSDNNDKDGDFYVIRRVFSGGSVQYYYPNYSGSTIQSGFSRGWASQPDYRRICSGSNCSFQRRPDQATRMDHPDLWNEVAARYYDSFSWLETPYVWTNNGPKNDRLEDICDAAKGQGVVVFSIGFEAPTNGRTVLRNCASSFNHYFDVKGLEISDAFQAIASAINNLKLIQ